MVRSERRSWVSLFSIHSSHLPVASVQAFCYNRDAAKASELHRRFWVGSIPELLQKVKA